MFSVPFIGPASQPNRGLWAGRNFWIPELGEPEALSRSLSDSLLVSYWL